MNSACKLFTDFEFGQSRSEIQLCRIASARLFEMPAHPLSITVKLVARLEQIFYLEPGRV